MRFFIIDRQRLSSGLIITAAAVLLFASGLFFAGRAEQATSGKHPIYQGSNKNKEIALTVNVFWGEEYIPEMLDILRKNNIKATFFLGGTWVKKNPGLAKRIADEGHEIGSHGYSHPHVDQLSKSANLREMEKSEEIIYNATGVRPVLFAPPYGERGPAVLQAAEDASYTTILWSIDTIDWQLPQPGVIVERVVGKAHNGAIVLMHPTAPTVSALPDIIKGLEGKGYKLVTVSRLLEELQSPETTVTGKKAVI